MSAERWGVVDEVGGVWAVCDSFEEAERRAKEETDAVGDDRYRLRPHRVVRA